MPGTDWAVRTVGVAAAADAPEAFALTVPAPNPTRGQTVLRVALPDAATVTAEVYDTRGRLVATLADGAEHDAGWLSLGLDASRLSSGVYVVRVRVGGDVATQTLTVIASADDLPARLWWNAPGMLGAAFRQSRSPKGSDYRAERPSHTAR